MKMFPGATSKLMVGSALDAMVLTANVRRIAPDGAPLLIFSNGLTESIIIIYIFLIYILL